MSNSNSKWKTIAIAIIIPVLINAGALLVWGAKLNQKVNDHIESTDVHMTFEKKVALFVPRKEVESELRHIREDLSEIKDALGVKPRK